MRKIVMRSFAVGGLVLGLATGASAAADPEIIAAIKAGNMATVRELARTGTNVTARTPDGTTALHWAVRAGNLEVVSALLAGGADVNAVNRYGVTPLSLAASAGDAAILERLIDRGARPADAERTLPDGQTLLMLAAKTDSVPAMKVLLAHGANVHAQERRHGTTAIVWATLEDRGEAVRLLLEAGADGNVRSAETVFPHTPPAVVGDKLEDGVSYVGQTVLPKGSWTPLMYAAREGSLAAARALADGGADLDAAEPEGTTPLIFAIINGHFDVATLLVEKGANPNLADKTGMTPLYAAVDMHTIASTFGRPDPPPAVFRGSVEAVRMLLAHGADPNPRLKTRILKRVYNAGDGKLGEGATPLMRAARTGDVTLIRILLEHGADPALTQTNGNTPIILAAGINRGINADRATEEGSVATIDLCVSLGVDVNAVNAAGDTALHTALGSPAIVRSLIDHGARTDAKNRKGLTALDLALANRDADPQTVAILRQATPGAPSADVARVGQ